MGLVHWSQVLVLSECGFESRPVRSRRKAVGSVCCVMHVKEPRTLIVKEKGLAPVFLDWLQMCQKALQVCLEYICIV